MGHNKLKSIFFQKNVLFIEYLQFCIGYKIVFIFEVIQPIFIKLSTVCMLK